MYIPVLLIKLIQYLLIRLSLSLSFFSFSFFVVVVVFVFVCFFFFLQNDVEAPAYLRTPGYAPVVTLSNQSHSLTHSLTSPLQMLNKI